MICYHRVDVQVCDRCESKCRERGCRCAPETPELYEWTSDQYHYPDTVHVTHQPTESIRILNVELLGAPDELDIQYVQVANVMLAMFSKYIPICTPAFTICAPAFTIHVFVQPLPGKEQTRRPEPFGLRPAPFKVRITAKRVPS